MIELKQSLLHLLSTEIIFNTHFHGEITILHSQFESWNQTLPHSTISLIMAYFGVSPKWLSFFQKFLQAPLKFADGITAPSRTRQRGVPEAHVLSDVFSEVILFCLDFSVNQSTKGQQLYRMHDDLWLWSSNQDTCVKAWKSILDFANVIGVNMNEEKSESAYFCSNDVMNIEPSQELPVGTVRWGFLRLERTASGAGRFVIDQSIVSTHIAALKQHLFPNSAESQSIFTWIRAWNTYASKFFSTNFGIPANCYGLEHVDDILFTLQRMQSEVFSDHGGSVTSYLKSEIHARFGISDVPDAFLYFPTYRGGLELHSPFIPFISIRAALPGDPFEAVRGSEEWEREEYDAARADFDNDRVDREGYIPHPKWKPENEKEVDKFFSFEEFKKWREEFGQDSDDKLVAIFNQLLERASDIPLSNTLPVSTGSNGQTSYESWVTQLYGPEMLNRFGSFEIAEKGWLPVGMVGLFKDGRMQL